MRRAALLLMRKLVVLALLVAAAVGAITTASAAAKPPGTNGKIVTNSENLLTGEEQVYTVDPNGTDQQLVFNNSEVGQWSPDGTRMVLVTQIGPPEVLLFNPDTGSTVDLGLPDALYPGLSLFCTVWSPDGARLACEGQGQTDPTSTGRNAGSPCRRIDMAYLEVGPADGPAVILVHGLTHSSRSWSTTMDALHRADPGLHILAIDQRGHGASSMPPAAACAAAPERCFRMADFAADLEAFMAAQGIGKATLAGHSLGTFVVQEVALTHPELVERAVLVATAARGVDKTSGPCATTCSRSRSRAAGSRRWRPRASATRPTSTR